MSGRQGIEVATYLRGKQVRPSRARVTVVIDGRAHKVPFGNPFIQTEPGVHEVSVYWGAQFKRGRPVVTVSVPTGEVVCLRWDGPRWIWQPARLAVDR